MYTLIEAIKENATSVFFKAEHKELETLHTVEITKDEIQNYLGHCGQNFIPSHKIAHIMHHECTMDICQDIVKFQGEYFVEDLQLIGWNVRNIYGKTEFLAVKEYGLKFIETLRNSMAVLHTEAVYK